MTVVQQPRTIKKNTSNPKEGLHVVMPTLTQNSVFDKQKKNT